MDSWVDPCKETTGLVRFSLCLRVVPKRSHGCSQDANASTTLRGILHLFGLGIVGSDDRQG